MAPMRVQCWRSKLPVNRKGALLRARRVACVDERRAEECRASVVTILCVLCVHLRPENLYPSVKSVSSDPVLHLPSPISNLLFLRYLRCLLFIRPFIRGIRGCPVWLRLCRAGSIRTTILKSFVFLRKLSGAGVRAFPQSSVPSVCSCSSYHPWSKLFAFLCVLLRPKNPCQSVKSASAKV